MHHETLIMVYLKVFLQALGFLIVCAMILSIRRKASRSTNEFAVINWLESMDVVAHGQRWQGARCKTVLVLDEKRRGYANYVYQVLCVTRSGRWFILTAETSMALLISWHIYPVRSEKAAELIDFDESDLEEFIASLDWPKEQIPGDRSRRTRSSKVRPAVATPSESKQK